MPLTRSKCLKLQHEADYANKFVMDPIEVIREPLLQDLIFQHLSASEVKNLFTVSKTWNQAASESRKAMSKIKLKVKDCKNRYGTGTGSIPFKNMKILLNSNRQYQNASFFFAFKTNFNRKIQLVERFSPSLVGLEYFCDTETANSTFSSGLNFPKLEKLATYTVSEQQTIGVLQGAIVLKEFDLRRSSSIPILMSVSSSLTTLNVGKCSKEDFEYILTSFPNLREFHVKQLSIDEISKFNNQNIIDFSAGVTRLPNNIISSMKNLEIFNIWSCDESNLPMILTEGKHLKKINISYWSPFNNSLTPTEIYENLMASDPTIPRDIEIVFGSCCFTF
jgi:hypothetical protein